MRLSVESLGSASLRNDENETRGVKMSGFNRTDNFSNFGGGDDYIEN